MTVLTTENLQSFVGNGIILNFVFTYKALEANDIKVFLDDVEQLSDFSTILNPDQNTNPGGTVTFITAPDVDEKVDLLRITNPTQELDYTSYDGFPADSHEGGLDKLTMLLQQNENELVNAIRVPVTDPIGIIKVLPPAAERAEKFIFFDEFGNVTALEAEITAPAVIRVDIQDGSGGEDSRSLMQAEVVSGGPSFPKIGFTNINSPNGPIQLNSNGKIPLDLINVIGIQLRGPFRGDDLCDKPGDEPLECNVPDTRNPSQRFPEVPFSNGDMFILTMQDPEVAGTMDCFESIGDVASQILAVAARDAIIFLEETLDPNPPNDVLVQEGWYLVRGLVDVGDASFIIYNDSGNTYVLGTNVQVALDSIDSVLLTNDAFFTTEKNGNRFGLPVPTANLNGIGASGFYNAPAGTVNNPSGADFSIVHTQASGTLASQIAIDQLGNIYRRGFDGTWTGWERLATETEVVAAQAVADQALADAGAAQGTANNALTTANLAKPEVDFLRTGDRLDIFNVRTS